MKHTKKVNRKGQLQMTETIAILFIFFCLVIVWGHFLFPLSKNCTTGETGRVARHAGHGKHAENLIYVRIDLQSR